MTVNLQVLCDSYNSRNTVSNTQYQNKRCLCMDRLKYFLDPVLGIWFHTRLFANREDNTGS